MSGPDPREVSAPPEVAQPEPFNELRAILLAPEQARLRELTERLDDPRTRAHDVGGVLPEAIALRAGHDDRLSVAMRPVVSDAMRQSIRRDPKSFADALFPALGPAIRKAIAATLGEMVQSLNQVVEHTFSVRGMRWRMEAIRTGRPFAEVVLLRSLVYRVEQIFLVHRETGLLLQHVVAGSAAVKDADMASAMLTAIRDFARDTFDAGTDDALHSLNIGELTLWIEQGPHAIVAAVIRGEAPLTLRDVLRECVERVHLEHLEPLEEFQGDATPFETARPALEACLVSQYAVADEGASPMLKILTASLAVLLLVCGILWLRAAWNWRSAVSAIRAEPGIVVTEAERAWFGANTLAGLRDPLAADPAALLAARGYGSTDVDVRMQPFASSDPAVVSRRARELLAAPDSVQFAVRDGVLVATGSAPASWIARARDFAPFVAGVRSYEDAGLLDTTTAAIRDAGAALAGIQIPFAVGSATPDDEARTRIAAAAEQLRKLDALAADAEGGVRVSIVGQADATGTDATNARISQQRADAVAHAVDARSLRNLTFDSRGLGATPESDRSVSFVVENAPRAPK